MFGSVDNHICYGSSNMVQLSRIKLRDILEDQN
jgi:hypothetical protein